MFFLSIRTIINQCIPAAQLVIRYLNTLQTRTHVRMRARMEAHMHVRMHACMYMKALDISIIRLTSALATAKMLKCWKNKYGRPDGPLMLMAWRVTSAYDLAGH